MKNRAMEKYIARLKSLGLRRYPVWMTERGWQLFRALGSPAERAVRLEEILEERERDS